MKRPAPRIFAFPKTGISYNEPLYLAVERTGTRVREGIWSGSWLLREVKRGDLWHIHWPSLLYFDQRSRRRTLVGLLRFVTLLGLLRARGARIVWTAHNLYPHDGGRALWVHRAARRYIVRLADAVLAHGPSAARIVQKEFDVPARKLREIPHGHWIGYYPDTTTRAAARKELGSDDATYVYAFVGTCKPYKNLEGLLRAFVPNSSGARLLIVGHFHSEAYLEEIRRVIADLCASSVQLEPCFIADAELQTFLRAADAVVIPYREILTSGSAMLALGFARPVVVPRLGALVDLVDDSCGVLYDADDPRGLERALAKIGAAQFSEERILERARQFRWEDSAEALVALTGSRR